MARNSVADIRKKVHFMVRGKYSPKNIKVSNSDGYTIKLLTGGKIDRTFWGLNEADVIQQVWEARL